MDRSVYTTLHLPICLVLLVSGMADDCPYQNCDCDDNSIECDSRGLMSLPPLLPVNIREPLELSLNGNFLATIPAGSLPPKLLSIDLEGNPIKSIDQDAFNGSTDTLEEISFANAVFTDLPGAFLSLNNLLRLEISDTQIKTWNLDIMMHIGATLQTLTLSNVGLTFWPSWIQYMPHLESLILASSSITVPDDAFDNQLNTLTNLNLANGILTEVPSAVSKLTNLQYISLDNNAISKVTAIPDSPLLATVILNGNVISDAEQLREGLKNIADSLSLLMVNENQLTRLPDLSAMKALDNVYLTHNPISYIGTSKIPPSLSYFEIEQNNLQSLDSFMRNALNLIVAKLQYNSIKEILAVDVPASLQEMDISYNSLTELTDHSFPPNSSMQTLTLDNNPIAKVSSKAFANLSKMMHLSMAYTKITRLPLSLTYLTSAVTIELSGNDNMICTCTEKEIRSWLQLYHVEILGQCGVTSIDNFLNVMSEQCPD